MAAADPANPQSWNRYAYVMNNPLNATDPLGLQTASENDQCSPNSGAPVGDGNAPEPGLECGTGALDSSDPGDTPQCSTDPNAPCIVLHTTSYAQDTLDQSELIASISEMLNHMAVFQQLVNGTWHPHSTTPIITASGPTPWYKNSCVTGALKSGAISVGIDTLGFLPEAGGVARVVGHQAGYVGKVADNLGKNMLKAGTETTGTLASAIGFSSSDRTTWVSAGITAADFVPVLSDFTTPAAIIWDASVTIYKVHQCHN